MKKRILIFGGGFVNKGAEAMVKTVTQKLRPHFPEAEWFVEGIPEEKATIESLGFHYFPRSGEPWTEPWEKTIYRFYKKTQLYPHLSQVTDFLDVSGFAYANDNVRGMARSLTITEHVRRKKGRVLLLPQAFGEMSSPPISKIRDRFLGSVDSLFCRDRKSLEFMEKALPNNAQIEVFSSPDMAFRFQGEEKERARQLLAAEGLAHPDRPFVAISPNMRIYEKTWQENGKNSYVDALVNATNWLLENQSSDIVFVPHEISCSREHVHDDRFLVKEICRLVPAAKDRVHAMTGTYTAEEIKAVIGCASFLIASRYHALIGALSQRIPVFVVAWSHKYHEVCADVGLDPSLCIDCGEEQLSQIQKSLENAWNIKNLTTKQLQLALPNIERSVDQVFDKIADLLKR